MEFDAKTNNALVKVLLTIVFSAATTALLSNAVWKQAFKTFFAGICAGMVFFIIGSTAHIVEAWLLTGCFVISAFVSSIWPLLGDIARKYIKKKNDDILSGN